MDGHHHAPYWRSEIPHGWGSSHRRPGENEDVDLDPESRSRRKRFARRQCHKMISWWRWGWAGRTPGFCQINLNFCNPSGGQLSFVNSHSTRPRKCGQDQGGSWPFLFSVWRINGWLSSYLLKNPFTVKRSSELKSPGDFCFDVCFSAGHLNWKLGNFLFTSSTTIFYRSLNW